jgi:hypothetical protein
MLLTSSSELHLVPLQQTLLSQSRRLFTLYTPMNSLPTTKHKTLSSTNMVCYSRSLRVSLYSLIRLVFLMKTHCVLCEFQTQALRRAHNVD